MSEYLSRKGKIAWILYFVLLLCIVVFGVLYFLPFDDGNVWTYLITLCVIYSLAAAGAYFGDTVWKKIGLTLLFGALFALGFLLTYDKYTLSTERIDLLLEKMEDPNEYVRDGAISNLKREPISNAIRPRVVNALIAALEDESSSVRRSAASALQEIGDETAIPALVSCLIERKSEYSLSEEVANALEKIGWQPTSEEERVLFFVAKKDADELMHIWDQTKRVLLKDLQSNKIDSMKFAVYVFLSVGNEEIIDVLIGELDRSDCKEVAEIYLNCGNTALEHAAEQWAHANGYTITYYPGSAYADWGSW
jgi:energy-coupling factor transporter transmembrane protein EcfT